MDKDDCDTRRVRKSMSNNLVRFDGHSADRETGYGLDLLDVNVANQTDLRDRLVDSAVVWLEMYMRLDIITPGCDCGWWGGI
jgi:hypothetical protein